MAEARRDTVAVRAEATKEARDLLERISASRELNQLAVNPLLLTMMATIHRFRGKLPERQIELYREIWEVFLPAGITSLCLRGWLQARSGACLNRWLMP